MNVYQDYLLHYLFFSYCALNTTVSAVFKVFSKIQQIEHAVSHIYVNEPYRTLK